MKILGVLLILFGIFAFVTRGVNYREKEQVAQVGNVEANVEQTRRIPLGPVTGTISILAGVALLASGRRRDRLHK